MRICSWFKGPHSAILFPWFDGIPNISVVILCIYDVNMGGGYVKYDMITWRRVGSKMTQKKRLCHLYTAPPPHFQIYIWNFLYFLWHFIEGLLPKDVQIHLENIVRISHGKYTDTEWGWELGNYITAWSDYTPLPLTSWDNARSGGNRVKNTFSWKAFLRVL